MIKSTLLSGFFYAILLTTILKTPLANIRER